MADQARLGPKDTFKFGCHPGISCFNTCCSDVNIFLSPYDVLRLKNRLGISSTDFLQKHTLLPVQKDMTTPVVILRMNEDEEHSCPFLTPQGCGVYTDRPWPCRMYPVGLATSRDSEDGWRGERYYFLLREEGCQGFGEAKEWTIQEWMDDQEVDAFEEWGEAYKELSLHKFFEDGMILPPEKMEMFFNSTYDLDKFREFVFGSTLLERFDVDEDLAHRMKTDDEALLRFGFFWARFALFGEPTMKMRPEAAAAVEEKFEKRKNSEKKTPESSREEAK
ncbi:YkgJ family cysteine cluster protein [Gemmatimonadota bacterium]